MDGRVGKGYDRLEGGGGNNIQPDVIKMVKQRVVVAVVLITYFHNPSFLIGILTLGNFKKELCSNTCRYRNTYILMKKILSF